MPIKLKKKIVVAMSGGVDSSVTALLLKQQGYEVIGLFMKNWDDDDKLCPQKKDYQDLISICDKIKIPLYTVNFTQEYWDNVFKDFIKELELGFTPNPDVLCNREIKFKVLLEKAFSLGADFLATGHYASINNQFELCTSVDTNKDQTYFLYTIKHEILKKVLFPLGSYPKSTIRKIAKDHHLITHDKKDSTGICFIGKRNFKEFIQQYIPSEKGGFYTLDDTFIQENDGAPFYTIGQRKGLNIGGEGKAWYVVDKDNKANKVYVVQGDTHPALYDTTLLANEISWVGKPPDLDTAYKCSAKIRYRQTAQKCLITRISKEIIKVKFLLPQRAITPRQSIVFYKDNVCLGGAMIMPKND